LRPAQAGKSGMTDVVPKALSAKAHALVYWQNPKETAAVVGVGLLWFFLIGVLDYASTTVLCYLALFHLVLRLVYRNSLNVLAGLNLIQPRPEVGEAPETFVTEEDVQQSLTAITALVNATLRSAYALAVGDCTPLVLKWIAGLWATAVASKIFGTTGLFFLAFAGAFSAPKVYQLYQPQIDRAVAQASDVARQQLSGVTAKASAASKELLGKLPAIPKASDLKQSSVKPKAL